MQKVKFDGQEGVSQPYIDSEGTEAELKLGCLSLHITREFNIPSIVEIAMILAVLPVTTATVECSFSSMKLIKTRFESEWRKILQKVQSASALKAHILVIVTHWNHYKTVKHRKISL